MSGKNNRSPNRQIFSRFFAGQNRFWGYAFIFFALILPIAAVGYVSYNDTRQAMVEEAQERRKDLAAVSAAAIATQFDGLVELGTALANRTPVSQSAVAGRWLEAMNALSDVPANFPQVDYLLLADAKGTIVADLPAAVPSVIGQGRSDWDWYRGVSRGWQPYVSEIYQKGTQPTVNVVAVAVPIRGEKQEVIGILVLQIRPENIIQWLRRIQPVRPAYIYLVDQRGNALGSPGM